MTEVATDANANVKNASSLDSPPVTTTEDALSPTVLEAFGKLARERAILEYDLETRPISGLGENSYGLVLQVKLTPRRTLPTFAPVPPFYSVLKISPKNAARRAHMKVTEYYEREVFMYERVFRAFADIQREHRSSSPAAGSGLEAHFNVAPEMYHYSMEENDEFIIFEDLSQQHYSQNARANLPTYDLVSTAIKALSQLHAMSFVLQARRPELFAHLVASMKDNLFTNDIEAISLEFGKTYVRRTRQMIDAGQGDNKNNNNAKCLRVLDAVERDFKHICLRCVDGSACAPYAVICHGDFWNNNILYHYDSSNSAISAKLIDFQMSRYASPVLDVVHYLFACTEKDLRDSHFQEFIDTYYDTLRQHLQLFQLDVSTIYPRAVFEEQLRVYGVYGFCMSAFAIPFFISTTNEMPDPDEVSQAIKNLSNSSTSLSSSSSTTEEESVSVEMSANEEQKCRDLIDEYDMLTERSLPIFKRRMTGIVEDLVKYNMVGQILKDES